MPLELSERPLSEDQRDYLAKVLKQDEAARNALEAAHDTGNHRLLAGVFNARPVAMLLLRGEGDCWTVEQLVVHPATRGRGVATELLRLAARTLNLSWPPTLDALAHKAGLLRDNCRPTP